MQFTRVMIRKQHRSGYYMAPRHIERDQRFGYTSPVQLLIPFHPWFLRLPLRGLNLSTSGVLAEMNPQMLGPRVTMEDLTVVLNEGDPYHVQLTSAYDHLESPVLAVRLRRKIIQSNSLKLGFSFDSVGDQLYGLIHEIRNGGGVDARAGLVPS